MKSLGIDIGASAVKMCLLNDDRSINKVSTRMHYNRISQTIMSMLDEFIGDSEAVKIGVCGRMSQLFACPNSILVSDLDALNLAADVFFPQTKSIISMGARDACYIEESGYVARNTNCSSGAGAFFEEQALRLGININDISEIIQRAKEPVNIAGRCSVFAKTDMINHMQSGRSTEDILLGLSYAFARNFRSNTLKNRSPKTPVLLTGGVMKNMGIITAIKHEFHLDNSDIILFKEPDTISAIGAALLAKEVYSNDSIRAVYSHRQQSVNLSSLAPLNYYADPSDNAIWTAASFKGIKFYLGIDVGSTSINLVLLSDAKQPVYTAYIRNIGNPVNLIKSEISRMYEVLPKGLSVESIAVTGSGREYVARAIGANTVVNEITAQVEGTSIYNNAVDTIFEIGGQDSKYMSVENGNLVSFEMNKVCAAGTGAFLEEQIKKLGITTEEFVELAMKAQHPCEFSNKCTVHIESDVTSAIADGYDLADICAGLVYAVVSNYINRVVGKHKIGDVIALQGGIAFNKAVICAFRSITGKAITVSPYFSVTGALGAAALLLNKQFLTFDEQKNRTANIELSAKTELSFMGEYAPPTHNKKGVIGIPRAIGIYSLFPLFRTFFTKLGYEVLLSPMSNKDIVEKAGKYATEETCFPIKLSFGHIEWLLEQGVDYIFLPSINTMRYEGSKSKQDYSCVYMQTVPILVENAFELKNSSVKLLTADISIDLGKKYMQSIVNLGKLLGSSGLAASRAALSGYKELAKHHKRLVSLGETSLKSDESVFVIVSHEYTTADPILNMNIVSHLNRLGCKYIYLEHLLASVVNVDDDYNPLYWSFAQKQLTGLKIIKDNPNLYPIYITNHGCGPDTVVQHFFDYEYGNRPYLQLEVDEHSSYIGVMTRIEAFLYSIQKIKSLKIQEVKPASTWAKRIVVLPEFGEYSSIFDWLTDNESQVLKVDALKHHNNFTYALNKEYHSLLVSIEEIKNTLITTDFDKEKSYTLYYPSDEGAETFGMYGLLIEQYLRSEGYDIKLNRFVLEDIIANDEYYDIFKAIFTTDINVNKSSIDEKVPMVIGEPLCVYKEYIYNRNISFTANRMSLGEALLFHTIECDKKGIYKERINKLKLYHQELCERYNKSNLFTQIDTLFEATQGQLESLRGNFGKYRFAKLMCLNQLSTKAILLNSTDENISIILKNLIDANRTNIQVPIVYADTDFGHKLMSK